MNSDTTVHFDSPIALFPLPSCVLLPHVVIPLHIFEPRYRAMVRDVLDDDGLVAMAVFEGEDWKKHYEGNPPLRPIVCVGQILRNQQLEDGRYNILLRGLHRARIEKELPHAPYRMAQLTPIEIEPMEIDLTDERQRLRELVDTAPLPELESIHKIQQLMAQDLPTAAVVDLAIMISSDNVEQRYQMLAEADVEARVHWLEHLLRTTRRSLALAKRFAPEDPSLN